MIVKILSAILGLIAGLLVYPWFDQYVLAIIAFLGAICVGVVVYLVCVNVINGIIGESRKL